MKKNDKIFLAGHKGLAGSAILAELKKNNYKNIITVTKKELDLLDQKKVYNFLKKKKPNYVIIAAALAGGIIVNSLNKGKFLCITTSLIEGCFLSILTFMPFFIFLFNSPNIFSFYIIMV